MNPRDDNLLVMLGELSGFSDESVRGTATVRTAGQRRRAEGAVLVAPVLDAEMRPHRRLSPGATHLRIVRHAEDVRQGVHVRARDELLHPRQRAQWAVAAVRGEASRA